MRGKHTGSKELLGAIDLGGTKILSSLFTAEGDILEHYAETSTPVELAPAELIETIADSFRETVQGNGRDIKDVTSLGIGVPTTIQYEAGLIDESPNLPRVKDYPLAGQLSANLGMPVVMEKDANCFLLGEMNFGAARGSKSCCGLTLGTGLGLGVAIEGCLVRGANSCAGEIWTAPYGDGIIEDWVSGTALAVQYCRISGEKITGEEICRRAEENEPVAQKVLHQMGEALGFGLSYLVNVLNPDLVVVGGSVARAWKFFATPMHEVVDKHRIKRNVTQVIQGVLDNKASLYGAVSLLNP